MARLPCCSHGGADKKRQRWPVYRRYPLGGCVAYVLVEPLDRPRPGLWRGNFVVAFRRGVVEEAVHRIRPDMTFIGDVVCLQRGFLGGPAGHRGLVEGAMVDQDSRLDLGHILR